MILTVVLDSEQNDSPRFPFRLTQSKAPVLIRCQQRIRHNAKYGLFGVSVQTHQANAQYRWNCIRQQRRR